MGSDGARSSSVGICVHRSGECEFSYSNLTWKFGQNCDWPLSTRSIKRLKVTTVRKNIHTLEGKGWYKVPEWLEALKCLSLVMNKYEWWEEVSLTVRNWWSQNQLSHVQSYVKVLTMSRPLTRSSVFSLVSSILLCEAPLSFSSFYSVIEYNTHGQISNDLGEQSSFIFSSVVSLTWWRIQSP
jgi:hypothetical protein